MEQNIQKSAAGFDSHTLWSGPGVADKTACIAVFVEENAQEPLDTAEVLRCAREGDAAVYAFYIRSIDLAHYGRVDHLAPAGDMEAFQHYTTMQDVEQAQQVFSGVLTADDLCWRLQVLYKSTDIAPIIARLQAEKDHVTLVVLRKNEAPR